MSIVNRSRVHNPRYTSVKSILAAALDRIENFGWTKNQTEKYDNTGTIVGYCAIGAMLSVSRDVDYAFRARRALENAVGIHDIVEFNDTGGTNKRDVVRIFKKALKLL